MSAAAAYAAYLVWLLAGCLDFACHRRTDLAHTSGLRESALHLVQLALIGSGAVLALAMPIGPVVFAALAALTAAHAAVGYLDTRQAWRRRDLRPFEQHLHSVLDLAPFAALWWLGRHYRADTPAALRDPALPLSLWLAVLAPALALCVLPALLEFRSAWAAARRGAGAGVRAQAPGRG